MTEKFYADKHTCEICLMQCRAEERQAIEEELGCSIEEAKAILDRTRLPKPGIKAEFTTAFGDEVLVELKDD